MESVATSNRPCFKLAARDVALSLGERTAIMGVLNVTPDSFSDGGLYLKPDAAVQRACQLVEEGADVIDVGGESSRPGRRPVSATAEADRILPVVEAVCRRWPDLIVSIDTTKAVVARQALEAGARLVNDISALRFDPVMADVVAASGAALVLMHMRGRPETMHLDPPSSDIRLEIHSDLAAAVRAAREAGVKSEQILIDPGIGFGKTFGDNLRILSDLDFIRDFNLPIVVGTSRKSFLARVSDRHPRGRVIASAASAVAAVLEGAHMIRAHDVAAAREATSVADAILKYGTQ